MFIPSSIGSQNSILPQVEQGRLSQLSHLANKGGSKTNEQLKSVSQEFESIFIQQLLKSMRTTVQKSGLFDSHATRMFESLHDEEMAKLMSEQKGIGLAKIIYEDLVRLEDKIKKVKERSEASAQKLNSITNF
tara:strand:- start:553 stop:951 length:399 start_codon:yes stop_codon:yes gene_type:complete